jgi:hypothetical protein
MRCSTVFTKPDLLDSGIALGEAHNKNSSTAQTATDIIIWKGPSRDAGVENISKPTETNESGEPSNNSGLKVRL